MTFRRTSAWAVLWTGLLLLASCKGATPPSPIVPAQLAITIQPSSSAQSGADLSTQPVVQLRDASGNDVSLAAVSVTVTIASGGGTLGGAVTITTNATGQAVFTDLSISGLIGTRTLTFTSGTLTAATTNGVDLTAGPAAQLVVTTQPSSSAQSGIPFGTQPVVQLRDASGNDVSQNFVAIAIAIDSGGGTLGGATAVTTDASGQAGFAGLSISGVVGTRKLSFTSGVLTAAVANSVSLTAGTATELVIITEPSSSAQNGVAFGTQPVVQLRDASGNDVSQSAVSVTTAINTGGGTLGGTATVSTDAGGQAVFTDLSIIGVIGSRTLSMTSGALPVATTTGISLTVGAAAVLSITTQPSSSAPSGFAFATQPEVQLRDTGGNDVGQSAVSITAAINSGGGTIGGTTTAATTVSGLATFVDLMITGTPGDRTLVFTSGALTSAISSIINVTDCSLLTPGDADGDRLPDCVETNTGTFVSNLDTGTDPNNADTDGDAINDGDEVLGTLLGLDLPTMGVSALRQDLLMEYDWFDDASECVAHSHQPTTGAVGKVTTAFANSPVVNPDGSTGINFIHDYGQGGVFTGGNLIADADGVLDQGVNGTDFQNYKIANFDSNRDGYFHYTMMPHRYNTNSASSGQAELPGDDQIVSLYCFGNDTNVAHTIMHELGHNLNLRHGGFEDTNYKPNYNSVMSYKYQFLGVDNNCTPPGDGILNYSIGDRITLDENNLDETQGVCGNPPGPGWDWNGDLDALDVGVVVDINNVDTFFTVLQDYNDWAFLVFTGLSDADGAPLMAREIMSCTNPAPVAQR